MNILKTAVCFKWDIADLLKDTSFPQVISAFETTVKILTVVPLKFSKVISNLN